jgi:hypothetical protein
VTRGMAKVSIGRRIDCYNLRFIHSDSFGVARRPG